MLGGELDKLPERTAVLWVVKGWKGRPDNGKRWELWLPSLGSSLVSPTLCLADVLKPQSRGPARASMVPRLQAARAAFSPGDCGS